MKLLRYFLFAPLLIFLWSCEDNTVNEFTGSEMSIPMISGDVQGNVTNGILTIRERTDGLAQIEIIVENIISNAQHPVHLHYGSLDDDGNIATLLNDLTESNTIGRSVTILQELANGEQLLYSDFLVWNGSIKVHFEASGPLENELIVSTNIGLNQSKNATFIQGDKEITLCNSRF